MTASSSGRPRRACSIQSPLPGGSAAEAKPRVLMIGAHPVKTLGGISTLISDILQSPLAREFEIKHVVSQMDECGKLGKLALMCTALAQTGWALLTWQPEVVYVHIGGNASLYRKTAFIALARLLGRRVLAHVHAGNFAPYFAEQRNLGRSVIVHGLGLSHKFIAVSEEMAGWLKKLWPSVEHCVIPNGVRCELFAPVVASRVDGVDGAYEADRANRSYALKVMKKASMLGDEDAQTSSLSAPRLLFIGKLGFLKGEADLLRALQAVKAERGLDFRLDILGQLSSDIHALVGEYDLASHIDQLGPVALAERIGYFQRTDIFVLPTYAEGMPIAVIEAMAAGLPCVTTPVGGIPELIRDGVEGFLVEPGDVTALAARLAQLIGDAALRRTMGARALQRAARYDLKLTLAQLGGELRLASQTACLPPVETLEKSAL